MQCIACSCYSWNSINWHANDVESYFRLVHPLWCIPELVPLISARWMWVDISCWNGNLILGYILLSKVGWFEAFNQMIVISSTANAQTFVDNLSHQWNPSHRRRSWSTTLTKLMRSIHQQFRRPIRLLPSVDRPSSSSDSWCDTELWSGIVREDAQNVLWRCWASSCNNGKSYNI